MPPDASVAFEKKYQEEQASSTRRFDKARRLGPITLSKVKPGKLFELKFDTHLVGGARLIHKSSSRDAAIWAVDENTIKGAIPFGPISVDKLNEILAMLGKEKA